MDFFKIRTKEARGENKGRMEVYPDFVVSRSKDLMVRGKSFYAIWDEEAGLWSTDDYDVVRLVDKALYDYAEKLEADGVPCVVKTLGSFDTNRWAQFQKYVSNMGNNSHDLDTRVTFSNTPVKKTDYASRRLSYALAPGDYSAYDELVSVLYAPDEREKFEWSIGAILSGAARNIEKFLVFYGPGGTGKSTILKIAEKLFGGLVGDGGYVSMFNAKDLVGNNNSFSTEAFKDNPLIAIQHDGDLSNIQDNTKLNSIVSHEKMKINEKYKSQYDSSVHAMLFMGTNTPVKITDAKSGLIRRLIDVNPSGNKLEPDHYYALMARIEFELGAIAQYCLDTYKRLGKNHYSEYRPMNMVFQTDAFFNFVDWHFDIFKKQNGTSLRQAYNLYKEYCSEFANDKSVVQLYKFREGLKNYFDEFHTKFPGPDGKVISSYYTGFKVEQWTTSVGSNPKKFSLKMDVTTSLFDREYATYPAQYANEKDSPGLYWTDEERLIRGVMRQPKPHEIVSTVLSDLDTSKLHFVKVPENHIVIDFDLTGDDGEKSLEKNLEAAASWPATYAELSKSGKGVHLHYLYEGDTSELSSVYSDGVEIKVYRGNASLRRRFTLSNGHTVSTINSGLPFKEKKVLDTKVLRTEKSLRELIARNLRKEIHPGTKPSIDFIEKILSDSYRDGLVYDVTDLRPRIYTFAQNSTNQQIACLRAVQRMMFKSETTFDEVVNPNVRADDDRLVFFDVEVYPNLFMICWAFEDSDTIACMINPSWEEVEALFRLKLVGFNCRKYDNHILWAASMGATIEELYERSQKIISGAPGALFPEAYSLSYADIYDFAVKKQGLKKWEIELGIPHMEMDIPWDQPVPEKLWEKVKEYCSNDVNANKAVFKHLKQDWVARQILAELSGLTENHTNPKHAERVIFGKEKNPQGVFVYTDLSKEFPGYKYDFGKSTYRGEEVGEGGYVYAEPGMYENVALLDVESMHPHSIKALNLFGPYTEKFVQLMDARLVLKHAMQAFEDGDERGGHLLLDQAELMMEGRLKKYIDPLRNLSPDEIRKQLKGLSDALKLVINTVYGLTAASFENAFRDIRNKDNIVAKRGALFMVDLKHFLQERGFTVAHIKTDSVKIPNATPEIIEEVKKFGEKYGYKFEHEATYEKFCLVNDAVFIAKVKGKWKATGAQFQHPYVYKTLFTHDPIEFKDLCETKQVTQGAIYIDFSAVQQPMHKYDKAKHFVGKTGLFVPVTEEGGGGLLLRIKDDKEYAITGTKGYFWIEAEMAKYKKDPNLEAIDMMYFERLVDEARRTIEKYGDFDTFVG